MKKIIFLFCCCMMALCLQAQYNLDSLWNVWNDSEQVDSLRYNAFFKIINSQQGVNPDSAIALSRILLKEAIEKENEWLQGDAYNKIGNTYNFMGEFDLAIEQYEKSLALCRKVGHGVGEAGALINIGMMHYLKGEYDKALELYIQGNDLCKEIGEEEYRLNALNNIGVIYMNRGAYEEAIPYFEDVIQTSKKLNLKQGVIVGLSNLGYIYRNLGNYPKTVAMFQEAYDIHEKNPGLQGKAQLLKFMGTTYVDQEEFEKAENYFQEALAVARQGKDKNMEGAILHDIGILYEKRNIPEQALAHFQQSITISEEIGSDNNLFYSLQSVGSYYQKKNELDTAIVYFNRSLSLAREMDSGQFLGSVYINIARNHFKQKKYAKAEDVGRQAYDLAMEVGDVDMVENSSKILYEIKKKIGKDNEALKFYEAYIEFRDSTINEANQKAVIKQQFQYDYEKQKELDDLENEKLLAIEKEQKEKQQTLSITIGIGLLISLILAAIIFSRLKITRQQKIIIEEQKARAEQSEKYKEQFLANMSHEIRTPMHAISGMVKILQRNEHPASQEVYLNAMHTSSDNLLVLLNDVLDMSKIEAGKLDIEKVPISPVEVIENVINILGFKAEEKGILLQKEIAENIPQLVIGDPARLNQILVNLVGNAIKFTDKGSVEISLRSENEQLIFSVTDTGIGIPTEEIDNIFGSFEQVKNSSRKNAGGTGLGLSISKQLVALMGGEIGAESKVGIGSTFYFKLPLLVADTNAIGADLLTEDKLKEMANSLKGVKILLAEDNEFNQMIAKDDLAYYVEDVEVEICEDGNIAVGKYTSGNYDLILMDVQMPKMDGFEATRKIREIEKENGAEKIPIIAMTASLLKSEIDNCYHAGMDNYIPKPYKAEELIGVLYAEFVK